MARPARLAEHLPHPRPHAAIALALTLASGCSQSGLVGRTSPVSQDAAPSYDTAPFDGPGFVDGKLHAHAVFNTLDTAYWFGGSGDSSKLEIYLFEGAPTCEDLSSNGWLTSPKVRPSDLMGFTIAGNKPGVYPVKNEDPPSRGKVYVLHTIDQADPVIRSEGESGSVTITSVKPGEVVSGAFEVTFSTGTLQGAFNAVWCPTGYGL
jgi:hypothetical protein